MSRGNPRWRRTNFQRRGWKTTMQTFREIELRGESRSNGPPNQGDGVYRQRAKWIFDQ